MKNSNYFFLAILFFLNNCAQAQNDRVQAILDVSKQFYKSNGKSYFKIFKKLKSAIAEDTIFTEYECYIDGFTQTMLFKLQSGINIFIYKSKEYHIDINSGAFEIIRGKRERSSIYQSFQEYPFVNYDKFTQSIVGKKFLVGQTETTNFINNEEYIYEFWKRDNSVKRMERKVYDKLFKGNFYEESYFVYQEVNDSELAKRFNEALSIISTENKRVKDLNTREKRGKPRKIDIAIFRNKSIVIKNDNNESFEAKYILLDFFYQGCMPCLKSHPVINNFYNKRNDRFIVLGVDHKLTDTLNMERYLDKYSVKYPVIVGEIGQELAERLSINVWPTFVLIDKEGNILEYQAGLSNKFFRQLERKLLAF
jgi:thiol-disulfide isomerase/thioredoxin